MRGVIMDRDGPPIPCVIRDVSRTGCQIICSVAHELPEIVKLKVERMSCPVNGRVMWRRGKIAGLELCFDDEGRCGLGMSSGGAGPLPAEA